MAAGNTVVVKPSEFAPVSAGIMLAEVAEEAGFRAGVINVVTHAPGSAGPIADEFFERPEVRVINLIGGVKTMRMLAERAGRLLKRTVMELGGFNPMVILDDVDMDYAVRTATFGSFFHQGQICLNTRRIIIQRKIYEEFLGKFVARTNSLSAGDPLDPKTIIGPIITRDATYVSLSFDNSELKKIMPWTGTHNGPQALPDVFGAMQRFWKTLDFKITDTIEQDSRVAFFGSFTYKSNATGKEITSPFGLLARFEGIRLPTSSFSRTATAL